MRYIGDEGANSDASNDLREACNKYAEFANKKQIYSQMEAGQAMDISKDAYVQDCTQRFVSMTSESDTIDESTSESEDDIIENQSESDGDGDSEQPPEGTDEESTDKVEPPPKSDLYEQIAQNGEIKRELIEKIKEARTEDERREYEEKLSLIRKQECELAAEILSATSEALDESQKKILESVKSEIKEEIDRISREIDPSALGSIDSYSDASRRIAVKFRDAGEEENAQNIERMGNIIFQIDEKLSK